MADTPQEAAEKIGAIIATIERPYKDRPTGAFKRIEDALNKAANTAGDIAEKEGDADPIKIQQLHKSMRDASVAADILYQETFQKGKKVLDDFKSNKKPWQAVLDYYDPKNKKGDKTYSAYEKFKLDLQEAEKRIDNEPALQGSPTQRAAIKALHAVDSMQLEHPIFIVAQDPLQKVFFDVKKAASAMHDAKNPDAKKTEALHTTLNKAINAAAETLSTIQKETKNKSFKEYAPDFKQRFETLKREVNEVLSSVDLEEEKEKKTPAKKPAPRTKSGKRAEADMDELVKGTQLAGITYDAARSTPTGVIMPEVADGNNPNAGGGKRSLTDPSKIRQGV